MVCMPDCCGCVAMRVAARSHICAGLGTSGMELTILQVIAFWQLAYDISFVATGPLSYLSHLVIWKMWMVAKKTLMVLPQAPAQCLGQKKTSLLRQGNILSKRPFGTTSNRLCCA